MRLRHVLLLLLLAFLWGTAYLFTRTSVPAFGPAPMVFIRLALGCGLVLLPLALVRLGIAPLVRHWRELAIFGIAFTALPFLGLAFAARSISAGLLAILQSAAPLFAAVIGYFWLKEPITRLRGIGLLVGFSGVALLVWDKVGIREDAGVAVLVTLLVTVVWGVSSNYAKARLHSVDPLALAAGNIGIAALAMCPIALLTWPQQAPGARAWAEVIFLGLGSTGLGFLVYFGLLRSIGAVRATSVTFLSPVVAMASAAVYIDEDVSLRMVGACAVILAGTALTLGLVPARRS